MIIFLGLAGSGKSVQGKMLATNLNCTYFSMGEFLRQNLPMERLETLNKGELINDNETFDILEKVLDDKYKQKEFILDGFPRTTYQAEWLIKQIQDNRFKITAVFHLVVSEKVAVDRLLDRHRQDDNMEAIRNRIREYNEAILPIIEKFKASSIRVYDINGERTPEEVDKDIVSNLT